MCVGVVGSLLCHLHLSHCRQAPDGPTVSKHSETTTRWGWERGTESEEGFGTLSSSPQPRASARPSFLHAAPPLRGNYAKKKLGIHVQMSHFSNFLRHAFDGWVGELLTRLKDELCQSRYRPGKYVLKIFDLWYKNKMSSEPALFPSDNGLTALRSVSIDGYGGCKGNKTEEINRNCFIVRLHLKRWKILFFLPNKKQSN